MEFAQAIDGEVGTQQDSFAYQKRSPAASNTSEVSEPLTHELRSRELSEALQDADASDLVAETEPKSTTSVYSKPSQSYDSFGKSVNSSGKCEDPDDVDSRGRRCGARAASARKGGY